MGETQDFFSSRLLTKALEKNKTLTTLDLSDNRDLGGEGREGEERNEGVDHLATLLKSNTTLTALKLGNTSISKKEVESLTSGLQYNGTLTNLDLSLNPIRNPEITQLVEAAASLTKLNIEATFVTKEDQDTIAKIMADRTTPSAAPNPGSAATLTLDHKRGGVLVT